MGEIKSTLDLVMERTRHLTLSAEEKAAQQQEQVRQSLRGLVQKFRDQALRIDEFREALDTLKRDHALDVTDLLKQELVDPLALDDDNAPLMDLMTQFLDSDVHGVQSVLNSYRSSLRTALEAFAVQAKKDLSERFGISGTAVIPNAAASGDWAAVRKEIQETHAERLIQAKDKLLGS